CVAPVFCSNSLLLFLLIVRIGNHYHLDLLFTDAMAYRSLHSVDELLWRAPLHRPPSTLAVRLRDAFTTHRQRRRRTM
ncbi:hypothetical protein QMT15_21075, partial [Cronobacter sakazakii]|nr:hypothetical protein [Cronobacter sakazakii]